MQAGLRKTAQNNWRTYVSTALKQDFLCGFRCAESTALTWGVDGRSEYCSGLSPLRDEKWVNARRAMHVVEILKIIKKDQNINTTLWVIRKTRRRQKRKQNSWGLIYTGRATRRKAYGTCWCERGCPHCTQATSMNLRSNLRARVQCGLGLSKSKCLKAFYINTPLSLSLA